jgi:hypothetical protein
MDKQMSEQTEYFVNNLNLRVSPKGLIVEVYKMKDDPPRQDLVSDLPEWVFRSALTIWFEEGHATLHGAVAGEKIKYELMSELNESASCTVSEKIE